MGSHHLGSPQLLPEFKLAWSQFLAAIVDQEYRDTFAQHLRDKQHLLNLA